jgi:hypothetical protein
MTFFLWKYAFPARLIQLMASFGRQLCQISAKASIEFGLGLAFKYLSLTWTGIILLNNLERQHQLVTTHNSQETFSDSKENDKIAESIN